MKRLTETEKGQHPMKPHRMRMVHDLIVNYDMHRKLDMCVCVLYGAADGA
jgi:hypothetical protein